MFIRALRKGVSVVGIIAAIGLPWLIHHWPELAFGKTEPKQTVAEFAAPADSALPIVTTPPPRERGYND